MGNERLRFSVVLFAGFELLDVFGPVQLLKSVPDLEIAFAGPSISPVPSSQGVEVVPTITYGQIGPTEILSRGTGPTTVRPGWVCAGSRRLLA